METPTAFRRRTSDDCPFFADPRTGHPAVLAGPGRGVGVHITVVSDGSRRGFESFLAPGRYFVALCTGWLTRVQKDFKCIREFVWPNFEGA